MRFPVAEISKVTGYSRGNVSDYLNRKKDPSERFITMFYNWYQNVPREATGSPNFELQDSGDNIPYSKKRLQIKNNSGNRGIPIYEAAPVTLGNIQSYRDQQIDAPDFWITIPQLRDCNYGCRAKGDSMHPLIRTNALVIGKEITDLSVVVFGEVYIIKTKNGIETVKYIHPVESDPESVLLVPYNEKAKITPIHKSDILKLYEAKAVFNTL